MESLLTVREILQRPHFAQAQVVAGETGLNRHVRWVHVLEVADVELLVHGEEMILTTGIPFQGDAQQAAAQLERLIKHNVSCLCIELGKHFGEIPQAMLELADRHGFPLIVFPVVVRFVDITQDVHSLIINKHHLILQDLERISRQFHRLTLTSQGVTSVLKLLQTSVNAQVVYLPMDGNQLAVPSLAPEHKEWPAQLYQWLRTIPERTQSAPYHGNLGEHFILAQPVGALGKTWAHIVLVLVERPQERDYLILDSASLSISQDLLRKRYMEERKLYTENLWIDDLLHARVKDEEQLKSFIGSGFKQLNEASFQVCLIELGTPSHSQGRSVETDWEESIGIHLSLVLRSIFEQHGFLPLMTLKNNRLVVIAVNQNPKRSGTVRSRLQKVLDQVLVLGDDEKLGEVRPLIGVGRSYKQLMNAHLSYQESIQAIALHACFDSNILFFEELGVYQLLYHINDRSLLEAFVTSYLGPLMEHDETKGSELIRTLQIYLDHDGSKQIVAEQLFIVRQSLYYRLEKIAELLGEDFMSPEKRLALQVAIRAYQLLRPGELTRKPEEKKSGKSRRTRKTKT